MHLAEKRTRPKQRSLAGEAESAMARGNNSTEYVCMYVHSTTST